MGCIYMSVIVLVRDGNPLGTDIVPRFVFLLLYTCFVVPAGDDVPLFMWYECSYYYQFC